ncbi:MAG: hypothetical protein Q8O52_19315 [Sulfuritalea sp.]|nr:hypothetical protein [Sulfuritalea sp.]
MKNANYQGLLAIPVVMPKALAAIQILDPDNPDVQAAIQIESERITKELLATRLWFLSIAGKATGMDVNSRLKSRRWRDGDCGDG